MYSAASLANSHLDVHKWVKDVLLSHRKYGSLCYLGVCPEEAHNAMSAEVSNGRLLLWIRFASAHVLPTRRTDSMQTNQAKIAFFGQAVPKVRKPTLRREK